MSFVRFVVTAFCSFFCFFPLTAFSCGSSCPESGFQEVGLYVGGMYKPASPAFSDLTLGNSFDAAVSVSPLRRFASDSNNRIDESASVGDDLFDRRAVLADSGSYKNSPIGHAATIGYARGGVRAELELLRERFDVGRGYFSPQEGDAYRYRLARVSPEADAANRGYVLFLRNDGMYLSSGNATMCKDFEVGRPIKPYVCAGFGVEGVNTHESYAYTLAYQVKGGVSWRLRDNVTGFCGFYYRSLGGSGNISVAARQGTVIVGSNVDDKQHKVVPLDPILHMDIAYYGIEVGFRVSVYGLTAGRR
ncbi:P44/Msp2 family outer membrane protein [Candidatus Anaplasma sp. TIGMIC]|uniref:P44/Msp2 family outer membrane protein n=1 Tax=Candidatus Anaplasma sp. TIGMIC TaxID=3020713 RepID=UPI00232FEE02|nr:P44/Msp2 family outer membrane protein [Candidatus Anaplasma sp. TIGMIC]MDB1135511.1 P44/Msp2 family outer membrane protein [Candidatus Anaplasma sp. TIGMIC]